MLSAATGALLMSPALAQDDSSSTEEVTVPLEGEVTIEVEVTDVETSAGDGGDGEDAPDDGSDADTGSDDGADTGEGSMDDETGDASASSGMAEDGAATDDGGGLAVADGESFDDASDAGSGDGMAAGEDGGTDGDMTSGESLSAEEGQRSGTDDGAMPSDSGVAVDGTDGDTMATGDAATGGDMDDRSGAPDYGPFAGMTVGDILSMEVQTPDQRRVGDIDYLITRGGGIEAVIGVGGFLSLGEHTVALPLEELQLVADGDRLLVEYSEDELKAMPQIDESGLEGLDDDLTIDEVAGTL
jgi:hypothetical protein